MGKEQVAEANHAGYKLASVEEAAAPEGCGEDDKARWFRYVIERGSATIVGQRRGTRQQVTTYANDYVEELNARSNGQSASLWAPRQKK